jgi:tRNA (guanosine-2'-O-)-methyltransferase
MKREDEDAVDASLLMSPAVPWPAGFTPERVIEVLEPLALPERREKLEQIARARIASVTVLFDAPHDPHNGAAVLRSCDAFGLPELHVIPREESFLVGQRVAKGSQRWVDIVLHETPERAAAELHAHGFELVAAEADGELLPEDLASIPRVAIVLGNEHDGLSAALSRVADRSVRIPMRGFVESLNVSVAAGVLMAAATAGRKGDLGPKEFARYYSRALYRSVPRAGEVLAAWNQRATSAPST